MKKLLVLVLVLGVSSFAGATTISLDGEGTEIIATPGDDITVYVTTDGSLIGFDVIISVAGGDVIIDATRTDGFIIFPGWDYANPIGLGTPVVEIGGGAFSPPAPGVFGYATIAYTGGTQVVSIAAGTSFGGSYDTSYMSPDFSTGVVAIIPEPGTLVLLGLGGLLLRKRR